MQVLDRPQVVRELGGADLADQHRRLRLLVLVHRVLRAPRWGLQHPRVLLGPGRHHAAPSRRRPPRSAAAASPNRRGSGRASVSAVSPRRSQPLCSISIRVRSSPSSTKRISTSVASRGRDRGATGTPAGGAAPRPSPHPTSCSHAGGDRLVDPAAGRLSSTISSGSPVTVWSGGHQRPDPRRPHGERVLRRAVDVEGDAQRRGHHRGPGSVFSASNRNRVAALPQTPSSTPGPPAVPPPAGGRCRRFPCASLGHHPGLLEQAQMAGDGRAADRQRRGDLVHRLVTVAQQPQDLPPGGVAQRVERVPGGLSRWHRSAPRSGPVGPHPALPAHR